MLSPRFQRRDVWKPAARSYFIDTLLRGYPVPPIHIRMTGVANGRAQREVIDGQQRLRALFSYFQGKYRLSRSLEADWAGKSFEELAETDQEQLRLYDFYVYQYQRVDDQEVLQIFARMNTYAVSLNRQELRNGQYFGPFKETVYSLALEYLEFWRSSGLFSDPRIARMSEAELVGELLVLSMDGLQDKKTSLDAFYSQLDQEWASTAATWTARRVGESVSVPAVWLAREEAAGRFRRVMQIVAESFGDLVRETAFSRVPLFYSLYAAVYHVEFGLPRTKLPRPAGRTDKKNLLALRGAIEELDEVLSNDEDDMSLPAWQRDFVIASSRQTDNLAPREARLRTILRRAQIG